MASQNEVLNLFERGKVIEGFARSPRRPLGQVSDFVTYGLAHTLEDIRRGDMHPKAFREGCERVLTELPERTWENPAIDEELALLDLLFLERGMAQYQLPPGPVLEYWIGNLAQKKGRIPGQLYHDLVRINPLDEDPRVFTPWAVGFSEWSFYKAHADIEKVMPFIIFDVKNAIQVSLTDSSQDPQTFLLRANDQLQVLVANMTLLKEKMPKSHFLSFREFLLPHPLKKYAGPSGASSDSIPALDILIGGLHLPKHFFTELISNWQYYPPIGQEILMESLNYALERRSLVDLLNRGVSSEFHQAVRQIVQTTDRFRALHYGATSNFLREVLKGEASSTGGVKDVKTFLTSRIGMFASLVGNR